MVQESILSCERKCWKSSWGFMICINGIINVFRMWIEHVSAWLVTCTGETTALRELERVISAIGLVRVWCVSMQSLAANRLTLGLRGGHPLTCYLPPYSLMQGCLPTYTSTTTIKTDRIIATKFQERFRPKQQRFTRYSFKLALDKLFSEISNLMKKGQISS